MKNELKWHTYVFFSYFPFLNSRYLLCYDINTGEFTYNNYISLFVGDCLRLYLYLDPYIHTYAVQSRDSIPNLISYAL